MRPITWTAALALAATFGLAAGCENHAKSERVATRPSLTIFPIQMAGEPREDVAATAALMLEQRGMDAIEVDGAVFSPDVDASFDDQAAAFATFVSDRDLYKTLGPRGRRRSVKKTEETALYVIPRRVRHFMRRGVITIEPEADAAKAASTMAKRKIGALPVVKGTKLVGIITATDLLRAFAKLSADMEAALKQGR